MAGDLKENWKKVGKDWASLGEDLGKSLIKSVKADQKGRILRMALEEAEIYGLMARYAFLKGASEDKKAFRLFYD